MNPKPAQVQSKTRTAQSVAFLALFAGLIWITRFWHSGSFGLYEDDYTRIPGVFQMTLAELGEQISFAFRYLADNAKPLHSTLIFSLALLGKQLGGLSGIYLVGFAVVAFNTALFFLLTRRLFDGLFAVCAGLAYALFSADTTQAFMTHSLGLQPSLTVLILALHAYLSGRRSVAYALAGLILLTYEVPFPVFLAAPLMLGKWTGKKGRELFRHGLIMLGIFLAVLLLRLATGESRVTSLTFPAIITTPLWHMTQGPLVAIGTYLYRPIQAIAGLRSDAIAAMIISFPIFIFSLSRISLHARLDLSRSAAAFKHWRSNARAPARLLRLSAAGLLMLVLAYALTFTVRAHAISGRDTRVHLAAAPGAALLIAGVCRFCFGIARSRGQRLAISAAYASMLAGLLGFGFVVQADYVRSWQLQKTFWRELLPQVTDVQEGQVILVEPGGLIDTRHIDANTWNMPRVLMQIIEFPPEWEEPPRAFRLTSTWREQIVTEDDEISLSAATVISPSDLHRTVQPAAVIFVETRSGLPDRSVQELVIDNQQFSIDVEPENGLPARSYGPLFHLMIDDAD